MGDERGQQGAKQDGLPRSPSGRIPKWVLDEAMGLPSAPPGPSRVGPDVVDPLTPDGRGHGGAVPGSRNGRRARSGRSRESWLPWTAVVVVLLTMFGWTATHGGLSQLGETGSSSAKAPTPGREVAKGPLGEPAPVPRSSSSYRFAAVQEDRKTPVTYDPCRPVHYVVRPQAAPPGGERLLSEAIDRMSRATGLQFHYDGTTGEAPSTQRDVFQRSRYGDRWAPVLIVWVTSQENPDFATDVVGQGGSTRLGVANKPQMYVTGQVQLGVERITAMLTRPNGRDLARAVIQHEFGHLVGLAHVNDPAQLMYPATRTVVTDYGPGDLTGLAALGRGRCAPEL